MKVSFIGGKVMFLMQKLKALEKQIMFIRWVTGEAYGKLQYVGNDFIEFTVIGPDHEYGESIYLRPQLLLEVVVGGNEVAKIVAELSHNLPSNKSE
jgi:hypothetical protein